MRTISTSNAEQYTPIVYARKENRGHAEANMTGAWVTPPGCIGDGSHEEALEVNVLCSMANVQRNRDRVGL
jgi:hypothetical protein